jgi:hypothetical protein
MKIKEIIKEVAKVEGKKDNDSIANIREIISILSDMIYSNEEVIISLFNNGKRRSKLEKKFLKQKFKSVLR